MDMERIIFAPQAYQEVCLLKRRIEFLDSCSTIECLESPSLMMQMKQLYSDVDMSVKAFSEKLGKIETDSETNSDGKTDQ